MKFLCKYSFDMVVQDWSLNNKSHVLLPIDFDRRPSVHPVRILYKYHVIFHHTIHIELQKMNYLDRDLPEIEYGLVHVSIYLEKKIAK